MSDKAHRAIVPVEVIERRIYLIRGHKVMVDRDLAALYQVKPTALRQQVKRNQARFPADFVFQLSKDEAETLVSQNVIPSKRSFGGSLPYAFTEQGVAMLFCGPQKQTRDCCQHRHYAHVRPAPAGSRQP